MRAILLAFVCGFLLVACGAEPDKAGADTAGARTSAAAHADSASATLRDADGNELGTLTLAGAAEGIVITGRLDGLPPGAHAVHLHAVGRCDPPAFQSAGDHWNPTKRQHGTESADGPHLGDLPNITVAPDSSVSLEATTPGGALRGEADALLDGDGAAVVIHAGPDDYRSQPSGDSGDRIACGVVTRE